MERLATDVERNGLTEDEFVELYPRLRRFAAVVGDRSDEPDDLVQDALTRLLRLDAMPDDPERYLRRTIVNLTVDRGRRRSRWSVRAPKLVDVAEHRDLYPSELGLLDTLDPSQRTVLWLADVEGWTFDEIAALLGVRPTTARKQASREFTELFGGDPAMIDAVTAAELPESVQLLVEAGRVDELEKAIGSRPGVWRVVRTVDRWAAGLSVGLGSRTIVPGVPGAFPHAMTVPPDCMVALVYLTSLVDIVPAVTPPDWDHATICERATAGLVR